MPKTLRDIDSDQPLRKIMNTFVNHETIPN